MADPRPWPVYCDSYFTTQDINGIFSFQRACTSKRAPWGWQMSVSTQGLVEGNAIWEDGMQWWRNGVKKKTGTGHPGVHPNYQFHGTWTGVKKNTVVKYQDLITFDCNVGPNCHASLKIWGAIKSIEL
jgi:hypothetical protein